MLFMSPNNIKPFFREISLKSPSSSFLILGPRMTGKTYLLSQLKVSAFYDLLDPQRELKLRARPEEFWQELENLKEGSKIVIDEIQKLPELLNYVQMGIEKRKFQFFLSGSSARKLKRGAANLLGGRAIHLNLYPLSAKELGAQFDIDSVLKFGSLPLISNLILKNQRKDAESHLKSYVHLYIKEEVQAEALSRNLNSFQRFLDIAAQSNAQMMEFANISRECSVPASTVKEYYSILEDTLMGRFVWPFNRSERKKARPKFYFFDCGVLRALQGRLQDNPSPYETGFLFKTWVANELQRICDYSGCDHRISLWRHNKWEVDFLIESAKGPSYSF